MDTTRNKTTLPDRLYALLVNDPTYKHLTANFKWVPDDKAFVGYLTDDDAITLHYAMFHLA